MGSLYFYYGSMNSSKTAQLAMAAHNYEEAGMRPLCLKPRLDTQTLLSECVKTIK